MASWIAKRKNLLLWLTLTIGLSAWFSYLVLRAEDKTALLPGITTDGHYQIEMQCDACHNNEKKENLFTSSGVTNSACLACHGEDLDEFSDSHPVRKFRNPENAILLEHVDAMNCITCHREHNPKITGPMAVTIPGDYCAHCHEVTLQNLPSHRDLAFQTCTDAGCHNFHDNMALAPSFLLKHYQQPDHLASPRVPKTDPLKRWVDSGNDPREPVRLEDANAPASHSKDPKILGDWHDSAHAQAGINCRDCHGDQQSGHWISKPDHSSCASCHDAEVTGFLKGRHGMRLAHPGLSPMTPGMARRLMKSSAPHDGLSCNSCHLPHRYDRKFASHQACVQCHDDDHTRSYEDSPHHRRWEAELAGHAPAGTGVSCATCHLPRVERNGAVIVNHNQSENLAPNEKMLRSVCMNCHGLHFAMSALADRKLIKSNFTGRPARKHPGIPWAVQAAIDRGDEDLPKLKEYIQSLAPSTNSN